jgi:hypothetical protein
VTIRTENPKMKKRTKVSLRTKIYLTIVALFALTGIIYSANPVIFSTFPGLTGVAISKTELFTTGYVPPNSGVYTLNCAGIQTPYQAAPGGEKYIAIAGAQSAAAGFTPRDVFVTLGSLIVRATPPGPFTFFTSVPCSDPDHTTISFDKVGTSGFGNDMIVACKDGGVFKIDNLPGGPHVTTVTLNAGDEPEGPVVAPLSFGPFGGQILVADEGAAAVNAIDSAGNVTHNIFNWPGFFEPTPEALSFIPLPQDMCTFCGFAFFQTSQQNAAGNPSMYAYPPSDFTGLGGSLLVTLEEQQRIILVQFLAGNYTTSVFDEPPAVFDILEGANFVDCSIPTPTPTPTATSTATPTFTPTPSATFTPTPSATFTPTPSATFTPTPSATFTPTPTPTPTSTPQSCTLGPCTPPYPTAIPGNARASIAFNESTVLRAFRLTGVTENCIPQTLQLFYNDEHALTLGVRRVETVTCLGTTATDYPVTPMVNHPADNAQHPMTGATEAQGGVDTSGRPMFPAMFITDITADPNSLAGDWQFGGTGIPPDAVFGTWKAAVRTIDQTTGTVTVTPDADPAKNNWNLDGGGPDAVPTPTPANEGYGAECRWDMTNPSLGFMPGHTYRLYFMVHDGDQNKTGGDAGQACVTFTYQGPPQVATPTPTPSATPTVAPVIVAGGQTYGGSGGAAKTIKVTFQNNTATSQVLDGLGFPMTWPQSPNGNLKTVKMGGTTIFNTSTANPPGLNTNSLLGSTAQRTIAAGSCATLTFTFTNNVSTNPANYSGSAHFNPGGSVTMFP